MISVMELSTVLECPEIGVVGGSVDRTGWNIMADATSPVAGFAQRTVVVSWEHGLHLAPCSKVATIAQRFSAQLSLTNGKNRADAKRVLDLLTLAASQGTELLLEASGDDAHLAVETLADLFLGNLPATGDSGKHVGVATAGSSGASEWNTQTAH